MLLTSNSWNYVYININADVGYITSNIYNKLCTKIRCLRHCTQSILVVLYREEVKLLVSL